MKEAAGEANLTVIAIILIGVVAAVVTPLVNSMMQSAGKKACCTDAGYVWKGGKCLEVTSTGALGTADKISAVWDSTNRVCKGTT